MVKTPISSIWLPLKKNPNNFNFVSLTSPNVCCHYRLLLCYPGGSSKSLCTSLTPVQTVPPMYCSLSWEHREARVDQYNQVLLLRNNRFGGLDKLQCPVEWSVDIKGPKAKRKLAGTRERLWLRITGNNHIHTKRTVWRWKNVCCTTRQTTLIYNTCTTTHKRHSQTFSSQKGICHRRIFIGLILCFLHWDRKTTNTSVFCWTECVR